VLRVQRRIVRPVRRKVDLQSRKAEKHGFDGDAARLLDDDRRTLPEEAYRPVVPHLPALGSEASRVGLTLSRMRRDHDIVPSGRSNPLDRDAHLLVGEDGRQRERDRPVWVDRRLGERFQARIADYLESVRRDLQRHQPIDLRLPSHSREVGGDVGEALVANHRRVGEVHRRDPVAPGREGERSARDVVVRRDDHGPWS
jgi:hypothetical protein